MPRKVFKNPNNIPCPCCKGTNLGLAGFTSSNHQVYVCKDCRDISCDKCNYKFSLNPVGRPLVGEKPMTSTERSRRQYAKEKKNRNN